MNILILTSDLEDKVQAAAIALLRITGILDTLLRFYKLNLRFIMTSMLCHFNSFKFPHNLKGYIKWSYLLTWQDVLTLFCWAWGGTECLSHFLRRDLAVVQSSHECNVTHVKVIFVLLLIAYRLILAARDLWLTPFYEGTFSGHKPKIYTITVVL